MMSWTRGGRSLRELGLVLDRDRAGHVEHRAGIQGSPVHPDDFLLVDGRGVADVEELAECAFVDVASEVLVGFRSGEIRPGDGFALAFPRGNANMSKRHKVINKAIQKAFKKFPPKR